MRLWLSLACLAMIICVCAAEEQEPKTRQRVRAGPNARRRWLRKPSGPNPPVGDTGTTPNDEAASTAVTTIVEMQQEPLPPPSPQYAVAEAIFAYPQRALQRYEVAESRYDSKEFTVVDSLQERDYKHHEKHQCYPHTVTKYKTIYKDRKANVFNKIEIRNPRPQVHKTKETRFTTIRYPVFITQVIKPLLTQVETKVKPMFFTKTLKRIKTIVFTVTGIGQVTVTSVKYEKEYVTRCQKKGYGGHHVHKEVHKHKGYGVGVGYHRRQDHGQSEDYVDTEDADYLTSPSYFTERIASYEDIYRGGSRRKTPARYKRDVDLVSSIQEQSVKSNTPDTFKVTPTME